LPESLKAIWLDAESHVMTIVTLEGHLSPRQLPAGVVRLLRRPRWQSLAACRGEPVEMFIPDRGGPSLRAKQLCAGCPVQAECLKYSLAIPDLVGYWAGTNERERRRLRAARRRDR
jgi:WhiB family redox-sensing transcriptional regulator